MKKYWLLFTLSAAFAAITLSSYWYGPAYGGGINGTGAVGSTGGCSCHAATATTSTTVTVQLLSGGTPVTSYVPGNTYTLKISGTNTGSTTLPNFGFQACVVKASVAGTGSAVSVGTFGTPPASTHVQSGTVQVFEHYNASFGDGSLPATTGTGGTGSTYLISISWTAPTAGTGSVVLYAVLNAVNHNGASDPGDLWNVATPVTICESPAAITGTLTVCAGATSTLSDATGSGTWSSLGTSYATIGSGTGTVTGVSAGTATINYTTSCGTASAVVTVNAAPSAISGMPVLCSGSTVTLTDATSGGTWSSTTTSVATVGTGGVVTGVSTTGGTSVISYTIPTTGCSSSETITVNPAPPAIGGTASVCVGGTATLTETVGGAWSTSSPGASVGSATGVVTGISAGVATITFTEGTGCQAFTNVTVNALPVVAAIGGATTVCQGATGALTDATSGGVWTSSSPAVATVGTTGTVSGILTGSGSPATSVITYSVTSTAGCRSSVSATVTVNPLPVVGAISGTLGVCQGGTTLLADATTGGTWSSSTAGVAAVGTGGLVSAVLSGSSSAASAVITYSVTAGGCSNSASAMVTVNPLPLAITGAGAVCSGGTLTVADGSGPGVWSSSAPGVATVGSATGLVTGVTTTGGSANITYTLSTGCIATALVSVNPLPAVAGITGTLNVCAGSVVTLADATPGGDWSASGGGASVGSTGTVTGIAAGTDNISYTVTSGAGCTNSAVADVTVNLLPASISGAASVCAGAVGSYTDLSGGGAWSVTNTTVATAGSSGILTGLIAGTDTLVYTLPTGCAASRAVTVNPDPLPLTAFSLCVGANRTLAGSPAGGAWSCSPGSVASVGTSGTVTGTGAGNATVTYALSTGCAVSTPLTVNANPASITGPTPSQVCIGSGISLADATPGGSWSVSSSAASVGSTGVVTGTSAGGVQVTYTLPTGCIATRAVTVNAVPPAISGGASVCTGQTITVADAGGSGTWASANAAVATVGSLTGMITGLTAGIVNISYTVAATGCSTSEAVTVNALTSITGLSSLCSGSTTTLSDATGGGAWSSSNTAVATIGSATGFLSAITTGIASITYTLPSGCYATIAVPVISAPAAIMGPGMVCMGTTATLTETGGGNWTSSNPSVASIGSISGIISPVTTGTISVTYSLGTGCSVSAPITINAASAAITGTASVCVGRTTLLSDVSTGAWSGSSGVATVAGTSGTVTGVSAGTDVLTFTATDGCMAFRTVTVNALPMAITGASSVCAGNTVTLIDGSAGGTWSSAAPATALVAAGTGMVTGVAAGTASISYTFSTTGCATATTVTVNASPGPISGSGSICIGAATTLTDGSGGSWSSSSLLISIGSGTGVVTGVATGTAPVTYTTASGCSVTTVVTVNPLPAPISGVERLCVGNTSTLTDGSGGSWTSGTPGVAIIGSVSGVVTAVGVGVSTITYTASPGCLVTAVVSVNAAPAMITGGATLCAGSSETLADATAGGTWSGSPAAVATIGSGSGILSGLAAGTEMVTYTLAGCTTSMPVTVNALPAVITGVATVCTGATTTLSDGGGGTWTSGAATVATVGSAGLVTGISTGTSVITYTLPTGCMRTLTVTVNPVPSPVSGVASICAGAADTLTDGTPGGGWASSATAIASVGTSGIVTGIMAGVAHISYLLPSGCVSEAVVTVNALPEAISGVLHVCTGTSTMLSDTGSGSWSAGSGVLTVGASSGIVTGVSAGEAMVTYTNAAGCFTIAPVTVNPAPNAGVVSGVHTLCADSVLALTDTASGGVWSSVITTIARVGSTGLVTGIAAGADTIKYTVTNSCGSSVAAFAVTVNPLPDAGMVTGLSAICTGVADTLGDTATGGTWSSSATAVATIGASSGVLAPVAAGTCMVTYSVTNLCGTARAFLDVTVNQTPSAGSVSGPDSVCLGDTISFADTALSGVWSVSNPNAVISAGGSLTGLVPGLDTVFYTLGGTCGPVAAWMVVAVRSHTTCNVGVAVLQPEAAGLLIYPNPNTGAFNVRLPDGTVGDVRIQVTDVEGRVVTVSELKAGRGMTAQFSGLAPGAYLVKAVAQESAYYGKVVVW